MSNTPRIDRWHLPMVSRNSDLRKIENCPASFLLSHVYEGRPSVPMILGQLVHDQIEQTITNDLSLDISLDNLANKAKETVDYLSGLDVITTSRKPLDKLPKLAARYFTTWWNLVHPDSPERLDVFKHYHWPPQVEVRYTRAGHRGTKYGQWATIDAVFSNSYKRLIVDWKSAVRDQTSDDQLNFYRLVAGLQDADAAYLNLHKGTLQWAEEFPTGSLIDDPVRVRIRRAESQKDRMLKEMPRKRPNRFCDWCPVQAECNEFDKRAYRKIKKRLIPMTELPAEAAA